MAFQTALVFAIISAHLFRKYDDDRPKQNPLIRFYRAGIKRLRFRQTADTYDLDFSKQKYTEQSIEVNGQAVKFRAYEGVVYVRNPVDTRYEIINIYVPEAYYNGGEIDGFNAETAPIFLPNQSAAICRPNPANPL